jgi:hypothetical protein
MLEKAAFLLFLVGSTWSIPLLVWALRHPCTMPFTKSSTYYSSKDKKVLKPVKIRTYLGEIRGPNKYDGERRAFIEVTTEAEDGPTKVVLGLTIDMLEELIEGLIDIHEDFDAV